MKIKIIIATLLATFGLFTQVQSATVLTSVETINQSEFNDLLTNPIAFHVRAQAGGVSGFQSNELYASANVVVTGEHDWLYPEEVGVAHDSAGNITITAGADSLSVAPLLSFDTLVIRVRDQSAFGSTSLSSGSINSYAESVFIPDVLENESSIYFSESFNFKSPEFSISALFSAENSAGDGSFFEIYGVDSPRNVPTIPEPSSALFLGLTLFAMTLRRCR